MTFPEFSEFSESWPDSRAVWLPEVLPIWQQIHLLVLVIQSVFSLLPLGRYLLPLTTLSRYLPTNSSGKLLFTTISRNVSVVRCRITILFLDLVMSHWIHWIQRKSFRENSNVTKVWCVSCVVWAMVKGTWRNSANHRFFMEYSCNLNSQFIIPNPLNYWIFLDPTFSFVLDSKNLDFSFIEMALNIAVSGIFPVSSKLLRVSWNRSKLHKYIHGMFMCSSR